MARASAAAPRWPIGSRVPENQLTARVAGQPALGSSILGAASCARPTISENSAKLPTHPELLNWLASEVVASGWKLKPLHKLIMLSSAYRMSSKDNPIALAKDGNNDLFWRFDMRRLSAEEIRDTILSVNNTLNLKMGGPSIYTEVPDEVLQTSSQPMNVWGKSPPEEQCRRSVYILVKRSLVEPIHGGLRCRGYDSSCQCASAPRCRQQALTSLNSKFFNGNPGSWRIACAKKARK